MTMNAAPVNGGIADTANIALCDVAMERAIRRADQLPGMVCLFGPSGWGKSVSAAVIANRRRAFYVQAQSVWTKKKLIGAILAEMSIKAAKTIPDMLDQAAEELAASGRPLIIDEMDHLVEKRSVEVIRDIYESSGAPILLIGEEQLPKKLQKWERFHGRILSWVPAQAVDLEDARKLAAIYASEIQIDDDLLAHLVDLSDGSVRRVAVNLDMVQETAFTQGWTVVDRSTWGNQQLYTGQAPRRKV